ncbi:MAG: hypothetical protein U1E65_22805 [Myxococcota bacterium]
MAPSRPHLWFVGPALLASLLGGCLSVDKIEVTPKELVFIGLDEKEELNAVALDGKGKRVAAKPEWSSSDPAVATVDKSGLVTTVGYGTTEMVASLGGKSQSAKVRVAKPTSIKITPENAELPAAGSPVKLEAHVFDEKGAEIPTKMITWASLDKNIATVESGAAQGINVGTGKISAKCGEAVGETTVTVKYPKIARLAFKTEEEEFTVGDEGPMPVYAFGADDKPLLVVSLSYKSSAPKILRVDDTGLATALKPGKAVVTVSGDGQSAKATVTVHR